MVESLLFDSEREVADIANEFEDLARHTHAMLNLAAVIVGCVENESVTSILPKVETLGVAARQFIQKRLEAATVLVSTVHSEANLIERLAHLTRGQKSVARETQLLCVLTKIEVAHLGELGMGFQYLAHELEAFSETVTSSTVELANRTNERRRAIGETSRLLAVAMPRIRLGFARIEAELGKALADLDQSMGELSSSPTRFRSCVEEIAGQISGVVAAVQSHDITRQQMEHVRDALGAIDETMRAEGDLGAEEMPRLVAGLAIQSYQMRNVREVMGGWVSRMRTCLEDILRVSSSELSEIGPMVLKQDQELTSHLAWIEKLEQECQADNEEIQNSLAGMSTLMQLVGEHLERSKSIRDRMQLLNFNSIVEASRLGTQADVILEISGNIKRISGGWSEMTDLSGQAMEQILELIGQTEEGMKAFSEGSKEGLQQAQAETRGGLEELRDAARTAAANAAEIDQAAARMRERITSVQTTADHLSGCVDALGVVLSEIDGIQAQMESESPGAIERCDKEAIEAEFSITYTTEMERRVLRAAINGEPLPASDDIAQGNDVELF